MESARETINNIMVERGFRHKHQVADYFGVSPQALSIWIAKNQIPPKHLLKISQEKTQKKTSEGTVSSSGSKEELQSVVNYLMRENIALKDELKNLKQNSVKMLNILLQFPEYMLIGVHLIRVWA